MLLVNFTILWIQFYVYELALGNMDFTIYPILPS